MIDLGQLLWALLATGIGFVIATWGGDFVVRFVLGSLKMSDDVKAKISSEGIPEAGRLIGYLERSIAYLMVIAGQPTAIAFIIAAKAIIRFESAKDRPFAEYFLVGTFASILWAVVVAWILLASGVLS